MKTKPNNANVRVATEGTPLWTWFSSVQAAIHPDYADRARKIDSSGWSVFFLVVVTSPWIGVLLSILGLAIPTVADKR